MKSIQTKILLLVLSCVLFASALNSITGLYMTAHVLDKDSDEIMSLMCEQKEEELDFLFHNIERSVDTMAECVINEVKDPQNLLDKDYLEICTENVEKVALNHVAFLEDALAVYLAYNPEYTSPTAGFFHNRPNPDADLIKMPRTNLLDYEPTDMGTVGWYYVPVAAGKPTWILPYQSDNVDEWMISYGVPVYIQDVLIGMIGIDIDFRLVEKAVAQIELYDSGYAFLLDKEGTVMYHPHYKYGTSILSVAGGMQDILEAMREEESSAEPYRYEFDGEAQRLSFHTLRNGMYLCVNVPEAEVHTARDLLIGENLIITLFALAIAGALSIVLGRQLTKPLLDLNTAARKAAEGEWDVELRRTTKDEVGELTDSFRTTLTHLNQYVSKVNILAYQDVMTGVKNKTAYREAEERINELIHTGNAHFAVAVFDVNNLKLTNDTHGHMAGDAMLCRACQHICQNFKHSPVYRIGGDEFLAILETEDYDHAEELLQKFREEMKDIRMPEYPNVEVACASGLSVYNPSVDQSFTEVFQRADERMYQNKADMKKEERL